MSRGMPVGLPGLALAAAALAASATSNAGCGGTTLLGTVDGDGGSDADDAGTWRPPIADIGDPGWRDSDDPWEPPALPDCRYTTFFPLDLWSEPGGVFLTYGWDEYEMPSGGGALHLGTYVSVAHNDGGGWVEWFRPTCGYGGDGPACVYLLDGRLRGGILGHGGYTAGLITPTGFVVPWPELGGPVAFSVVDESLAYAWWSGKVIRFDGDDWSPLPGDPPSGESYSAIWGNETEIWIAGENGSVAEWTGDSWRVHSAGTIADFTAIWGMGDRRIWLADRGLRYHDTDDTWTEVPWPDVSIDAECRLSGIRAFWGAGETLFFHTGDQIVRWDGTDFEVLGYWPARREGGECRGGLQIVALWGNAPDEAFLAVLDRNTSVTAECPGYYGSPGTPFILYWDGTTFHWM